MIAPQLPYAVSLPCTCGSQSVIIKPLYPIHNYCMYGYSMWTLPTVGTQCQRDSCIQYVPHI